MAFLRQSTRTWHHDATALGVAPIVCLQESPKQDSIVVLDLYSGHGLRADSSFKGVNDYEHCQGHDRVGGEDALGVFG